MGVFARWVAGVRVYARGVFVWVFACLLVCARLGVVGQCGPAAPAPVCLLACVLTLWRGLVGVCDAPLGVGVTVMGRDNHVPPHAVWRALSPRCVRVEERGGAHGVVNTERERERGGSHRPGNCGLAGGGVRFWCERPSGGYNPLVA